MPLLHPTQRKSFTINKTEATYLAAKVANGEKLRFQSLANRNWVNKIAKTRYGVATNVYVSKDTLIDPRYTVEGQDIPAAPYGINDKHYMTLYVCERDTVSINIAPLVQRSYNRPSTPYNWREDYVR